MQIHIFMNSIFFFNFHSNNRTKYCNKCYILNILYKMFQKVDAKLHIPFIKAGEKVLINMAANIRDLII